mmetsp:Transcript_21038/g.48206  ORF Transcript_21038/g.48206 Transcript_21038/m.48206 type:complete len:105 (-) Transcript_21038:1238-1552(-)
MTPEAMPQSVLFFCGLPQMALLLLLVQTRIRKRRRLARLLQQRKQLELMMRAASSVIAASMSVEADEASGEPRRTAQDRACMVEMARFDPRWIPLPGRRHYLSK